MDVSGGFLQDLALVLVTGAIAAVLFQRLRLPTVLGYLLAGVVIGPHVPIPFFADVKSVGTLAELGVTLLMFSIGLEFSLRKLVELGFATLFVVALEVALLLWLGFVVAELAGMPTPLAACVGAMLAITSTMVVVKNLGERALDGKVRDFVLGVLVVEDLASMLLLALLTAVVSGAGMSGGDFAVTTGRLAAFLGALVVGGMLVVPRLLRWVMSRGNREATLLAAIGVCFGFSLLAKVAGYSIALGAFLAGTLAAETGHGKILEPLVRPVRDMFAAIFFVATGMMIDPAVLLEQLPLALLLVGVAIVAKPAGIAVGSVLAGRGLGAGVHAALWLVPLGEYGFLVAQIGQGAERQPGELHALAAAVCVVTVLISPLFAARAERVAQAAERRLSPRLALFETLHGTWVETLKRRRLAGVRGKIGRIVAWLVLDGALVVAVVIGTSLWLGELERWLAGVTGLSSGIARAAIIALAALACVPFCFGIVRAARRLGVLAAEQVLPSPATGQLDLAESPRRSLVAAVQLAALLTVGVPVLAISQPFLPSLSGVVAVVLAGAALAFGFKRRVDDLDGHFRAGSAMVLEALSHRDSRGQPAWTLEQVSELLPGLGTLGSVAIESGHGAEGHSLDELDLHARTGVQLIGVARGSGGIERVEGARRLEAGDRVALTGTEEQLAAARVALERHERGA
ncbi:MAG: cation:proton antiporter [Planctomycetota bacterium]|nr:cation:proton antiporter [Planctomycetota bacterium]